MACEMYVDGMWNVCGWHVECVWMYIHEKYIEVILMYVCVYRRWLY